MYGELPSDLRTQDETLGPPPSWYSLATMIADPLTYGPSYLNPGLYQQTMGSFRNFGNYEQLGDREGEIEVNPVEHLLDLKFGQEMSKRIPREAGRYTGVDALSPLFRNRKSKFGFGEFEGNGSVPGTMVYLAISASNAYHGYKRNGDSVGWALGWFLFGFGPIGLIVSLIQGWGKPSDSVKLGRLLGARKRKSRKKK